MITTARQLKDLIRSLSKKKSADAQILMRNYMIERFLERISLSDYKDRFILKGGMLVAAMVGLDARSTMDLDATVKGANVSVEDVENIISSILSVPMEDGVEFQVKRLLEIMEEAEYPGVRVSMETTFDGVRTPLKIDISTGDVITPREVRYSFKLMLKDRSIEVWAYNLETVLAEKLETVISRNVTNTRMRDFYDIHILQQLHGESLSASVLRDALAATATKRGTLEQMKDGELIGKVHSSMYHQCQNRGYAAPVDVLMDIGVLPKQKYEDWRFGRVPYLEGVCTVNLHKLSFIMRQMRVYAEKSGLKPSFCYYKQWGVKKKNGQGHKPVIPLRFSKSGDPAIERWYATHFVDFKRISQLKSDRGQREEQTNHTTGQS